MRRLSRGSQGSQGTPPTTRGAFSVGGSRPRKRARADAPGTASGEESRPRPRARAAIACVVCRDRKTRCDGGRPVCGYCVRTGSACQYDVGDASTDRTLCHDMGTQILQAIEELAQLVKSQQPQQVPAGAGSNHPTPMPGVNPHESNPRATLAGPPHALQFSDGLDSIFAWRVFSPGLGPVPVDDGRPIPMPDELPLATLSELTRLQMNYRHVVHSVNPILDLNTLDHYVTHISENGFDWTTRTCLVALVCAIGAMCQEESIETPNSLLTADRSPDLEVAYRFWSVACKRLGRAMSQNTLESAQCLCLAGIWFMCNLQPLDAWKHFTMAGNCCYSTMVARNSQSSLGLHPAQPISQVMEHSIFYTAYKSELEIRYELALPGSVLEHIEDQLVFPSPPTPDPNQPETTLADETVTWYYYLAEIAARHLINSIIKFGAKVSECPNEAQARALLQTHNLFVSQLDNWYQSLPAEISFPPPSSRIGPEPDAFKRILRSRYLVILELLCRPFVRICLNYTLGFPDELIDEIASVASRGLQCCAWRLQAVRMVSRFDHGVWIWVRNSTACSMILIGAARRSLFPSLNAGSRLWMPENWRDVIISFLNGLEVFSTDSRGGVMECYKLVCSSLEELEDGAG